MSEVAFSPIKINSPALRPSFDVSKLDPNSPNFFDTLNKVFSNETSKLSPIAPGIFVANKPDAPLA